MRVDRNVPADESPLVWRFSVDTGGTFTDCVAVDPDGVVQRVKVLSSGALRGAVVRVASSRRIVVAAEWLSGANAERASRAVVGCEFRPLGVERDAPGAVVVALTPESKQLELDRAPSFELNAGDRFELRSFEEAPLLAARLLTGTAPGNPLPPAVVRLATTRGTNALLERRGAATALFISRGFGDLLVIGDQTRPDLFALDVRRPAPLYDSVVEVSGRLDADGSELEALDIEPLGERIDQLVARGVRSAAIALLHSYRDSSHEEALAEFLLARGFEHVSRSSAIAPSIRILPRAETATVNAYLAPIIAEYVDAVRTPIATGTLHVMTSAGGLVEAGEYLPKDSLLSGPAGGVAGAASVARACGRERSISFDMGGTSTDVARYDGDYEYAFEHRVGSARLVAPALAIETVAAGGGSICSFDGHRLLVGPESAGAFPGPACYGAGGPLTITDVHLLAGRLAPDRFGIPIDSEASRRALAELVASLRAAGDDASEDDLLAGLLAIADERMADAIRSVSVQRGYSPAEYALVAFGGAGGLHACSLAERLEITEVLVPAEAGLLSARGIADAAVERFASEQVLRPLAEIDADLDDLFAKVEERALAALATENIARESGRIRRRIALLRFSGQDTVTEIEYRRGMEIATEFIAAYKRIYGHLPGALAIEVESIRVVASTSEEDVDAPADPASPSAYTPVAAPAEAAKLDRNEAEMLVGAKRKRVPVLARDSLARGDVVNGPAIVADRYSTAVVEDGWRGTVLPDDTLRLDRIPVARTESAPRSGPARGSRSSAVELELFTNRFRAIAGEMGDLLQRTALSTNIKERLDFSCALLDPSGELVVNAPHIPVHLGALGLCTRRVASSLPLAPGDVALTNHPRAGGSHLPDVTVITPVHSTDSERLLGYVASRAHHAEIGGVRPGSMPPSAQKLIDEGVVLPPALVVAGGQPRWREIEAKLASAPHPSRAVADNLADLRAAVAANSLGAERLRALAEDVGAETVGHFMKTLEASAERHLRAVLAGLRLPGDDPRERTVEEFLDDGTRLRVRVALESGGAAIDFTGTSGVHAGNLNATPAIVQSAVLYVLRLLVDEPLPLNDGLLRPVRIVLPPNSLVDPVFPENARECPAVVGGNVETSQRIVDTLLKAFGVVACSQGTMNNVLFGSGSFGYYETIGGGAGAGNGFDGASAVHSHMTNTRITDPEILEHRYPVRLLRFEIRRGSGGDGRWCGGDGVVREIEFLETLELSLLSQHRREGPYGLEGGDAGSPGRQRLVRASGDVETLEGIAERTVHAGDRLVLETPGGGGFGAVASSRVRIAHEEREGPRRKTKGD